MVALPSKAGVEESPIGPPLDSDSSSSDFNSQSEASDEDEEEEEKVPGPEPVVAVINVQKTDRDILRDLILNTLYYYNCKEKVDAALSKIQGDDDDDEKKKKDKVTK